MCFLIENEKLEFKETTAELINKCLSQVDKSEACEQRNTKK